MRTDLAALGEQLAVDVVDLGKQGVQRLALDGGIVPQWREQLPLPFELLQNVGLQVGARGDIGDLEQRDKRGMVIGRRRSFGRKQCATVQTLKPHHRADAFVQRMFVPDHAGGQHQSATFCTKCASCGMSKSVSQCDCKGWVANRR